MDDAPGIRWTNNWDNGHKRTLKGKGTSKTDNTDPDDDMVFFHCVKKEGNVMTVDGAGTCKLTGRHPRVYVGDLKRKFNNVEVTCYARFLKPMIEKGSEYTTFRLATRSNHHAITKCRCNGKGYAVECFINQKELTFKDSRFRKELIHPHYANGPFTSGLKGIDMKNWLGMKFVLQTSLSTGDVVSKVYFDRTGGVNGGTWTLVGTLKDTGTNWPIKDAKELKGIEGDIKKCKNCIDSKPVKPYAEKITRAGFCTYLRTDGVTDSQFRWFSAREIVPLA